MRTIFFSLLAALLGLNLVLFLIRTDHGLASAGSVAADTPESAVQFSSGLREGETQKIAHSQEWKIEPIFEMKLIPNLGQHNLAVDGNGVVHLAYGGSHLYYSRRDNQGWHHQVVDSSPNVGEYASLAVDGQGRIHISYYDSVNGNLKYAKYAGGNWTIETVDKYGFVGKYTSLAVDQNGHPHIGYYDGTERALKYARHDGSQWRIEVVDDEGKVGQSPSLALAPSGYPHLSYYDYTNNALKYAYKEGNNWVRETVITSVYSQQSSLAIDSAGNPHLVSQLRYCKRVGFSWTCSYDIGYCSPLSLSLDPEDNPYAICGTTIYKREGENWSVYGQVADVGYYFRGVDITLDGSGKVHVVFLTENELIYANVAEDISQKELVTSEVYIGENASFDVDNRGAVHFAFFSSSPDNRVYDLNYAYWNKKELSVKTIERDVGYDKKVSIGVDSNHNPHVLYTRDNYSDLMYARWDANKNGWQKKYITEGRVRDIILRLDRYDIPHIVFSKSLKLFYQKLVAGTETPQKITSFSGGQFAFAFQDPSSLVLVYSSEGVGNINLAKKEKNVWHTSTLVSSLSAAKVKRLLNLRNNSLTNDTSWYPAMVLDQSGQPHITYRDPIRDRLIYLRNENGDWLSNVIDYKSGIDNSLAIDRSGNLHATYFAIRGVDKNALSSHLGLEAGVKGSRESDAELLKETLSSNNDPLIYDLRYARWDKVKWHTNTVVDRPVYSVFTAIHIGQGVPYIAFIDGSSGLYLAFPKWFYLFLPLIVR